MEATVWDMGFRAFWDVGCLGLRFLGIGLRA